MSARLLAGVRPGAALSLAEHVALHGALPGRPRAALLEAIESSGLRGRGGAHVGAALKLHAVADRRGRPIVVANGAESEPASRKDAVLLSRAPHLVLDGAAVAAAAIGAGEAILYVKRAGTRAHEAVEEAVAERGGRDAVAFTLVRRLKIYWTWSRLRKQGQDGRRQHKEVSTAWPPKDIQ